MRRILVVATLAAALLVPTTGPAGAHGGSVFITDVDNAGPGRTLAGHDFDPACLEHNPVSVVTGISTGTPPQFACAVTLNDVSSESTDLVSVKLEHLNGLDSLAGTDDDRLRATIVVGGRVPMPGGGSAMFDGPQDYAPVWLGATYYVLFHNRDQQVDRPTTNGGCPSIGTGSVYDQQRHWRDGHYKFLAVSTAWTGGDWTLTPKVGTFDPSPTGGFRFTDLDREIEMWGGDHVRDDRLFTPTYDEAADNEYAYTVVSNSATPDPNDTVVTIEAEAVVDHTDTTLCSTGVRREVFANHAEGFYSPVSYSGDEIDNVFGLSTADRLVVLPVSVPLSVTCAPTFGVVCNNDVNAVGGFVSYADNTHRAVGGDVFTPGTTSFLQHAVDNLGDAQTCPTPTFGGTLPGNPVRAENQPCQIDDDALAWPVLAEFHRSGYGFTF